MEDEDRLTALTENPEAEAAIINSLVLDPSQVPAVFDMDAGDFTSLAYAHAFRTILRLYGANKPIDILTLKHEGVEIDPIELIGQHAPAAEYMALVQQAAYRRRIMGAAGEIAIAAEYGNSERMVETTAKAADLALATAKPVEIGKVDLSQYRSRPPTPLLGWLAPEGTTVLYGEGGDGKGWIAARVASTLSMKVAILDFENHPNEWAYRLDTFGVSLDDVAYFNPPTTMERWADERTARLLKAEGIGFIIVDSAMYASNVDDPYSPQSAMGYKRARTRLGNPPALLLAHTSKAQDGIFGSVFWRNEARVVWRLHKDFQTKIRSLECRKANNYRDLEGKKFTVEFDEPNGILNLHEQGMPWSAAAPVAEEQESEDSRPLGW